jgi:hypothetical protein
MPRPYDDGIMKVLNLQCTSGHGFEGWFASDDDFMGQNGRRLIECPLCADTVITRMPAAPRLNLSGAKEPAQAAQASAVPAAVSPAAALDSAPSAEMQTLWLSAVRKLMAQTEDVGSRFAEEARRIHYGEIPQRGIRGQATPEQREALEDEGIETLAIPVPRALEGPLQ